MSTVEWQIGVRTGNWLATHRGIRIIVKRGQTGSPIEIGWFIDGRLAESDSLECELESAKKIGTDLVDQRIPMNELWSEAEKKERESALWMRPVKWWILDLANSGRPRRIQRKRTPGWVKPEGVRIVDRTTIFGNPYKVGEPGVPDQATAARLYERDLLAGNLRGYRRPNVVITVEIVQDELRGFDLACFCKLDGEPCHADVLLAVANQYGIL